MVFGHIQEKSKSIIAQFGSKELTSNAIRNGFKHDLHGTQENTIQVLFWYLGQISFFPFQLQR